MADNRRCTECGLWQPKILFDGIKKKCFTCSSCPVPVLENQVELKIEDKIDTNHDKCEKLKRQFSLSADTEKYIGLIRYQYGIGKSMSNVVEIAIKKLYEELSK